MITKKEDDLLSYMPATMKLPFSVLNKLGLLCDNKRKRIFLAAVYALFPLLANAVAMMQFNGIKGDISEFTSNLEGIMVFVQVIHLSIYLLY